MVSNDVITADMKNRVKGHLRAGNVSEAKTLCLNLCELTPNDAEVWHLLGIANGRLGLNDEAERACRRAIAIDPQLATAHCDLGNALFGQGRLDEAISRYREALRLQPNLVEALNNMGTALTQLYRFEEAAGYYEKTLRLSPNAMTFYNLANIYMRCRRYTLAVDMFQRALKIHPGFAEAYNNLGSVLRSIGKHERALSSFRQAVALKPDYVEAYGNVGSILIELGQLDEALASFRRALQFDPGFIKARVGEVRIFERQGDYKQAYAHLQPLLDAGEESTDVALVFASLCRYVQRCDDAIAMLERLLERRAPPLDHNEQLLLHFELGRLLDATDQYDRAFDHYHQANTLKAQTFSPGTYARYIDDLIAVYSADFMARAPRARNTSTRPLFIVGMPRSGTSLVEQILASHPQVAAGGELGDLNRLTDALPATLGTSLPYPQCLTSLTVADCDRFSQAYLDHLEAISRDALRVTDKMPSNFQHLGLIALLFPAARIIHCVRDPLDTCLSCYFQHFAELHPYAYDLGHLGSYYHHYQRLMQHWRSVIKLPMMEVRYEDLVANQEGVSRDLVAFAGLPWDEHCLRFHESKRVVATASYDQVRQPLYQRSVGRWRHYQRFLDPLIHTLNSG
jgi:tetratricopeptide (TPR) repeat protein